MSSKKYWNWVRENRAKPPLEVKWKELERYTKDSSYRSLCPECRKGPLFIRRDIKTFELLAEDNCAYCGRRFIYTDLAEAGLK